MIRKISKHSLSIIKAGIVLGAIAFSTVNFSDLHHNYIRHKVGKEVVEIIEPSQGGGTGFHVKAKSGQVYIMTNVHICEMAKNGKELLIGEGDPSSFIPRKVIFMSKKHDVCLVEPLPGHEGVSIASSVDVGEKVTIAGHPQLRPLSLEEGEIINKDATVRIAKSIITSEDQAKECVGEVTEVPTFFGPISICISVDQAYQAKLIAYPGNSGSPVVNKWGNVVGLLFAGNDNAITDSYLVKLEYLKEILDLF